MNATEQPAHASFWSTVSWPRQEGLILLVGVPLGLFLWGSFFYTGWVYALLGAAGFVPLIAVVWAWYRILKAWAEWQPPGRRSSWLKAAVRYLLIDP